MDQSIIDLYDHFTHGGMNRRQFLDRLTEIAGSSAAAVALLPLLQNDYARAAIVAPDDARLAIDTVSYDATGTRDQRLSGAARSPRANARRSSSSTKTAASIRTSKTSRAASRSKASWRFAVDLLSLAGGTPAGRRQGPRPSHAKTDEDRDANAALAAVPFLKKHAESTGKVGAVGFCWGGGMVNRVAVLAPI